MIKDKVDLKDKLKELRDDINALTDFVFELQQKAFEKGYHQGKWDDSV